jgi:hypothetical protein
VHVEDAVRSGDNLDDLDDVFPFLEDARRQTGGVGPRPSRDAILDPDLMALAHRFDSITRPRARADSLSRPARGF